MAHEYGRPISKKEAAAYYKNECDVRTKALPALRQAFINDPMLLQYYAGDICDPQMNPFFYFFDKHSLEKILHMLHTGHAEGIVVAPVCKSTRPGKDCGKPTIMIFPYHRHPSDHGILAPEYSAAVEYPGGQGNKGNQATLSSSGNYSINSDLPDSFDENQIL